MAYRSVYVRRRYHRLFERRRAARRRLGDALYSRLRCHAIKTRLDWDESSIVFKAAMLRLFYIARCEIAKAQ